jgi:hypothetical protein
MDAIEKYEILANGITIYSQNDAIRESYITNCASTNAIRKSDIYSKARHKDLWRQRYHNQCGVWIDWSNTGGSTTVTNKTIKLKIDLRKFLPLSNIKYLPAFAGKLELKLYFSTAGMVVANRDPLCAFRDNNVRSTVVAPPITAEFAQIGDTFVMITGYSAAAGSTPPTFTAGNRTINVQRDYKISTCETIISCFGLHQPIYDDLVARYSQSALTFPTQTLQFNTMSNELNSTSAKATLTITPRFVDTIFLLFPIIPSSTTVYKNPGFNTFQLSCGGYGHVPSSAFGTVDEPRLIEMCSASVKLNSDTFGLCDEVLLSLIEEDKADYYVGTESSDRTNFFIGIPTETDGTFQQGHTSNSPVNYELSVTQSPGEYMEYVSVSPIMGLLMDSTFSIQVNPNGQPPKVVMGPYDITSPVEA